MNISFILEAIGYLGSALIVVSMLMTSVVKLRVINSVGCLIFMVYAICIKSYPTAAMQLALMIINITKIKKLALTDTNYTVLKVQPTDASLSYFLDFYNDDIIKFFPDFKNELSSQIVYVIFSGSNAAGVIIANETTPKILNIELDYTTPKYRDCSVGKFAYNFLREQGFSKLTAQTGIPAHQNYLKKMGFSLNGSNFEINLNP